MTDSIMSGIRIFFSYRHNDAQEDVYHLHRHISLEFGKDLTLLDDANLLPGDNFLQWIQQSIQSADLVLVIIGKNWLMAQDAYGRLKLSNPRDFVLLEIESAFRFNKKIVPVILPGATMPAKDQLPSSIGQLADLKAFPVPERSNEKEWRNRVFELEDMIKKQFPFYKSTLFWVMAFMWPVIISLAAFFSGIVVTNMAAWVHIDLPPLKNEIYYFVATGIIWATMYVVLSTNDYTSGTTGILFRPFLPYRNIVSGMDGFINSFIFGFPFNILLTRLVAETIAWVVFHFFHTGFGPAFLLTYLTISILLLNTFSMDYEDSDEGRRETFFGNLHRAKNKYEYSLNVDALKKREEKAKLPKKKSNNF